jgi:hypothetical protein
MGAAAPPGQRRRHLTPRLAPGRGEAPLNNETAVQAGKVLDALAVLSTELSCHGTKPAHTLVLSAGRVKEVCVAIDQAVDSLKTILELAVQSGQGPVPPGALNVPGQSANE